MKTKRYTAQYKKAAAYALLNGMSYEDAGRKFKATMPQLRGWKTKHRDEWLAERDNPVATGQTEVQTEQPVKAERKGRISLTDQTRLDFSNKDPNYVYRGVVEDDRRVGKVESHKAAGWEPVPKSEGSFGVDSVGHPDSPGATIARASGLGSTTYLMRKRKKWEDEDMAKVQEKASADEEAIFGELNKPGRFGHITIGDRTETG